VKNSRGEEIRRGGCRRKKEERKGESKEVGDG